MKSKSDHREISGLSKEDEEWLNNNLTLNEVNKVKPKESVSVNRSEILMWPPPSV